MSSRQSVADTWSVDTVAIDGGAQPVSVATNEPWRLAVTIKADANNTGTVYVVPSSRRLGGLPLEAGAGVVLETTAEVFVYAPAGVQQLVHVVSESASC